MAVPNDDDRFSPPRGATYEKQLADLAVLKGVALGIMTGVAIGILAIGLAYHFGGGDARSIVQLMVL